MTGLEIFLAILQALPWTLALTLGSFFVGAILAIPLCAMRIAKNQTIAMIAASIILLLRSIPPIVWLFFIFFAFSENIVQVEPFTAAIMGLGLITAANMAEVYRGALKAVPKGQYEATHVLGLSLVDRYRFVVIPQVFRISIPAASTYCIGLLKDTAVSSTIGVPEIAQVANYITQQTFRGLSIYAVAAMFYFALSFLMAWAARKIDITLRAKVER